MTGPSGSDALNSPTTAPTLVSRMIKVRWRSNHRRIFHGITGLVPAELAFSSPSSVQVACDHRDHRSQVLFRHRISRLIFGGRSRLRCSRFFQTNSPHRQKILRHRRVFRRRIRSHSGHRPSVHAIRRPAIFLRSQGSGTLFFHADSPHRHQPGAVVSFDRTMSSIQAVHSSLHL